MDGLLGHLWSLSNPRKPLVFDSQSVNLLIFCFLILPRLPFYYVFKVAFIYWLIHPKYHGASIVFDDFVAPFLRSRRTSIELELYNLKLAFQDLLDVNTRIIRSGNAIIFETVFNLFHVQMLTVSARDQIPFRMTD